MLRKKIRSLNWKETLGLFKETAVEYMKESTLMHSASLAYYALFAMLPLIYLGIYFFGRIVGNEVVRSSTVQLLQEQVGISDISGIMDFLQTLDVEKRNILMETVGVVVLLFSSSAFLVSLKRSLNDFYNLEIPKLNRKKKILNSIVFRLLSIAMIALFGVLVIVFYLGQTVLLSIGSDFISNETFHAFYTYFLQHATSIVSNFIIFSFIFKYIHDGVVKWKLAMAGALVTAVLLYGGQLLIKFYLTNYFFAANGGIIGTFFVLLAWVYYSAQIIFFGAKFTHVYAKKVGSPIQLKFVKEEEIL